MEAKKIILYDGDCNLCNWSVDSVRKRDPEGHFKPVAFQTREGSDLARKMGVDPGKPHSVVLIDDEGTYDRSRAGIRILGDLKGFRFLSRILGMLPGALLDRIYNFIARHRNRIFGRTGQSDREG